MSSEFRNRSSDTMPKKNLSKNGSLNNSLNNSSNDLETKSNRNSPLSPKEFVRHRQHTPSSNLYPDISGELEELESYTSTLLSEESRSYYTSSSSNTFSPKTSPSKSSAYVTESASWPDSNKQDQNGSSLTGFWLILIIALAIIAFYVYPILSQPNNIKEKSIYSNDLRNNVAELKKHFPSQNELIWTSFVSGIDDVSSNRLKPAVFLLLGINDETTNCLAKKIAGIASLTLESKGYALLTPDVLKNNISMVYDKVEEELKRTKTVVFINKPCIYIFF